MAGTGVKKEFRIDSTDSARAPATINSEPHYYAQGLKPKPRTIVDVTYEETGEIAQTRTGKPVKIILKTTTYNDGVTIDTTVGEENEDYQSYLKTGLAFTNHSTGSTRVRKPKAKPVKAAKAAKE